MSQLIQWLTIYYTRGLSARQVRICLEQFQNVTTFFQATNEEWQQFGISSEIIAALRNPDWKSIERDINWVSSSSDHHIISYDDPSYPPLLKNTADPPMVLFLYGKKEILVEEQIAIVGSRHATAMGKQIAEQFAYSLAQAGLTITSGLATGIDAAGHRGALKAKGKTIAVAGTGLFHTYPRCHKELVCDIVASKGSVISEFPLAMPPRASHFPRRNRIIAGLSQGVLVVEAALKSGSLITARLAAEEGRDVFAIPGSIHHLLSHGCHHLIRQGAKLVETVTDILEELGKTIPKSVLQKNEAADNLCANLSPEYVQVLNQVGFEHTPVDLIILRSGLTAGEVSSILLTLELHGYIQLERSGYVRVINMAGHQ